MAEDDPCSGTKPLDDLVRWWNANRGNICKNPHMSKEYCNLTRQIQDYRRKSCSLMTAERHLEQVLLNIDDLDRLNYGGKRNLAVAQDCFCKQWGDVERGLDRLEAGAGFATQALVTRWLYEAGFRIVDIEVEHKDDKGCLHSFDIEIEDANGDRYDVEVWYGMGPLANEIQRSKSRYLLGRNGNLLCEDEGAWDEHMKYVSEYHCIGSDTDANFRNLMGKIGQLRKDRIGFVIACMQREQSLTPTLIPAKWGPSLPAKKCAIVLRLGSGEVQATENRGTGYIVHSPGFGPVQAAKNIIRSLKFEDANDDYAGQGWP